MSGPDSSAAAERKTDRSEFLPTASLETLRLRASLLAEVRQFFNAHGYLEVETPILSHDVVVDAFLEPFSTYETSGGESVSNRELFLQTSPEFGMKRLLAAGATAIYQITRVMRKGELGRHHNPEFTMLEWYRVDQTHLEQMQFVEELVVDFFCRAMVLRAGDVQPSSTNTDRFVPKVQRPFQKMTYDEAFEKHAGTRVLGLSASQLAELASSHLVAAPPGLNAEDRDGWLNLLLVELVQEHLGRERPLFLYDYPASQAALARIRHDHPPVAERFELYIDGIEICNGYHELTDPQELRERIRGQAEIRANEGRRRLPEQNRLLDAMQAGLPACAGVAMGFDRLMMLAVGAPSLADVIAFPLERA